MGIMESLFGKRNTTKREGSENWTKFDDGVLKVTRSETTIERNSSGNVVSKKTTTRETEEQL